MNIPPKKKINNSLEFLKSTLRPITKNMNAARETMNEIPIAIFV